MGVLAMCWHLSASRPQESEANMSLLLEEIRLAWRYAVRACNRAENADMDDYTYSLSLIVASLSQVLEYCAENAALKAEVGASQRLAGACPGTDVCQDRIAQLRARCVAVPLRAANESLWTSLTEYEQQKQQKQQESR